MRWFKTNILPVHKKKPQKPDMLQKVIAVLLLLFVRQMETQVSAMKVTVVVGPPGFLGA